MWPRDRGSVTVQPTPGRFHRSMSPGEEDDVAITACEFIIRQQGSLCVQQKKKKRAAAAGEEKVRRSGRKV